MVLSHGVNDIDIDNELEKLEYDHDGLARRIQFRDQYVRPIIVLLLVLIGLAALVFTAIYLYGIVEYIGWRHGTTIAYTISMGTLTLLYVLLDWSYHTGVIGYPDINELPLSVYILTRRYKRYFYLSPGRYYDDRTPENVVSVQLMRYMVPFLVTFSIIVAWVGDQHRHEGEQLTQQGRASSMCLIMQLASQIYLMHVIAYNRSNIYIPWDDVPTTLKADTCG